MKIKNIIPALIAAALILTGCGAGQTAALDRTGIILDKDLKVTQVIIESFDKTYYNADELKSQIEARVLQSAGDGESPKVTLKEYELREDGQLYVGLEFASGSDYAAFNGRTLFTGSVSEAAAKGYTLTGLKTPENSPADEQQLLAGGDEKAVIFDEAMAIVLPGKILYHSDNVALDDEKRAHKDSDMDIGIIVYE